MTDARGMTFIEFLDAKWGDIIGLMILACGVITLRYNQTIGMTFIGSGLTALKLKSNGTKVDNGASQTDHRATDTRVA